MPSAAGADGRRHAGEAYGNTQVDSSCKRLLNSLAEGIYIPDYTAKRVKRRILRRREDGRNAHRDGFAVPTRIVPHTADAEAP